VDSPPQSPSESARGAVASPPSKIVVLAVGVVFGPGAGHFLAGMPRRGVAFALGGMALAVIASVAVASSPAPATIGLYAVPLLLHLASLVDLARTPRERFAPVRGVAIAQILALLVAGVFLRNALRNHVVELYQQPSGSMIPTIAVRDHYFVSKLGPAAGLGDIVVFPSPEQADHALVKRIVGIGGDRIEQKGTSLSINGSPIPTCVLGEVRIEGKDVSFQLERLGGRMYLVAWDPYLSPEPSSWEVPPGEVFVVGDNRNNSHDSRQFRVKGAGVPVASLVGRATYRIFRAGGLSFGPLDDLALPPGAESLAGRLSACRTELGGG
jgi:signal peptidase I